jgi:hypothetical protein
MKRGSEGIFKYYGTEWVTTNHENSLFTLPEEII